MATIRDILRQALRKARVINQNTLPGDEAAIALEEFNTLMHDLADIGVEHTDQGENDTFALDDKYRSAVVSLLSLRLAEEYDKPVTPAIARDASSGRDRIAAGLKPVNEAVLENTLIFLPSRLGRYWGF